jgi:hypothetical protein
MEQAKMRRTALWVAAAAAAAVIAATLLSCEGCESKQVPVARLLAPDAPNAFILTSPATTLERLRKLFVKFEGSSVGEQAKLEMQALTTRFGFNPLDREGWLKAGMNPDKGLAVELEPLKKGGKPVDAVLILLGVSDQATLDKTVKRLAKERERAELYRDQRYKQAKMTTILRQTQGGERPLFVYAFYEGFAVFGDAENGPDAIKRMVDRKLQGGLESAPAYSQMLAKLRPGSDLHFFINEGGSLEGIPAMDPKYIPLAKALQSNFKGLIAAATLEGGVSAEVFAGISTSLATGMSSFMNGSQKALPVMLKNIGDDSLAVLKLSSDFQKLYARMKADAPEETAQLVKMFFGWMNEYTTASLDERLMPNISGDLVYALYPGNLEIIGDIITNGFKEGTERKLLGSVYVIGIKDTVKTMAFMLGLEDAMMTKGVPIAERQVNAVRFKSAQLGPASESAWSVHDNMLVGSFGAGRMEKSVLLSGGAPGGLLERVSSDRIRSLLLSPDAQTLYINFTGIGKALKAIKKENLGTGGNRFLLQTVLELTKDFLARLDDGAAGLRVMPDGVKLELYVNTR